jgi:hypothetical protein
MRETRTCPRCDGRGRYESALRDGSMRPCYTCDQVGSLPALDRDAIRSRIIRRDGELRRSAPHCRDLTGRRAYYVWRLARFHGGADTCMPIKAETLNHGDPFLHALEEMADAHAREFFGSDMGAARRWAGLL